MKRCIAIRKELTDFLPDVASLDDLPHALSDHLKACEKCRSWVREQQQWMDHTIIRNRTASSSHQKSDSRIQAEQGAEGEYEWSETRKYRLRDAILAQRIVKAGNTASGKDRQPGYRLLPFSITEKRKKLPYIAAAATLLILFLGSLYLTVGPGFSDVTETTPYADIHHQEDATSPATTDPREDIPPPVDGFADEQDGTGENDTPLQDVPAPFFAGDPAENELVAMEQFLERSERFLLLVSELEDHWEVADSIPFNRQAEFANRLQYHLDDLMTRYPVDDYPLTYDLFQKLERIYAEASYMDSQITRDQVDYLSQTSSDFALLTRIRLLRAQLTDARIHHTDMEVSS